MVSAIVLTACSTVALTPRTGVHIDYLNVVRLGGITYLAQSPPGGRPIASGDLGPVVRPLRTRLADLNDPARLLRDGDAAYLPVGTKLHQLKGYLPRFRLSASNQGQLLLFEAFENRSLVPRSRSSPSPGTAGPKSVRFTRNPLGLPLRAPPGALGLLTRLPAEHLKQPAPGSQVVEDNRLATAGRELRSCRCLFRRDRGQGDRRDGTGRDRNQAQHQWECVPPICWAEWLGGRFIIRSMSGPWVVRNLHPTTAITTRKARFRTVV